MSQRSEDSGGEVSQESRADRLDSAQATTHTQGPRRRWLPGSPDIAALFLPPERRWCGALGYLLVLVVTSSVAFLRIGSLAWRGRVWAEDGNLFLQQALTHGSLRSFATPYAGYVHAVPRTLVGLVHLFPLSWAGVLLCVAAALVQGWVATIGFIVISAHSRGRVIPCIGAIALAAAPLGIETIDNVANLQWYLWFGASIALLVDSKGWLVPVVAVTVAAAVASSPFGFTVIVIAGLRMLVKPDRRSMTYLLVCVAAAVFQIYGMISAPPRQTDPAWRSTIPGGYLHRVLGDAVFGIAHYRTPDGTSPVPGIATIALLVLAGAVLWYRARTRSLVVPAMLLLLSIVTFLPPPILNWQPLDIWANASRYYVAPALFLLTGLALLADSLITPTVRSTASGSQDDAETAPEVRRRPTGVAISSLLAVAILVCVGYGVGSTWIHTARHRDVPPMQRWSTIVDQQAKSCESKPAAAPVQLPISPAGWTLQLNCAQLLHAQ